MNMKVLKATQLERDKKYTIVGKENCYITCRTNESYFTFVSYENGKGIIIPNMRLTFEQITGGMFVEIKE